MHRILAHGERHTQPLMVMKDHFYHNNLPLTTSRALTFRSRARIRSALLIPWVTPFKNLRRLFIQTSTTPNADVSISKPL